MLVVVSVSIDPAFTLNSYVSTAPFQVISAVVAVTLLATRLVGASQGIDRSVVNWIESHSERFVALHTDLT